MKKTVRLFGPGFHRYKLRLNDQAEELDGLVLLAENLGDVLEQYAKVVHASIRPYDGSLAWAPFTSEEEPKFFLLESSDKKIGSSLVDVHIERDSQTICVKQNITFELVAGDIILIGPTAC